MEIPVLIQQLPTNGFRATSVTPVPLVAEASTREEALDRLRALIRARLSDVEFVRIQVPLPGEPHPWQSLAGTWKDHPEAVDFERNMQEYRQQVDSDPERL